MNRSRKRKRKIACVFTASRAEYGLLRTVILQLKEVFDVKILVAGMHLSPEFGHTVDDVLKDGLQVHKSIETLLASDSPAAISKSMALGLLGCADYFAQLEPDFLVVLGDRYETLAVCCAAMNQRVPIAHISGGETTEGAVDECIRHAITKMSYLHFTSAEIYRNRVIQLGEAPDRVFNVGTLAMENIMRIKLINKDELAKSLNFDLDKPYAVVTFHPATLEEESPGKQFSQILKALHKHYRLHYIFTYANADAQGRIINSMIEDFVKGRHNAAAFISLGTERYLSTIKHAVMVIGNSSSGIFEAPIFRVPTVNIGDRQKGRLQSGSIINCPPTAAAVDAAISKALDPEFIKNMGYRSALYGDGETSKKIVSVLKDYFGNNKIDLKKEFYDL